MRTKESRRSCQTRFYLSTVMSVLGLILSVLVTALAKAGATSCIPGATAVSFTTFTASPSSPAVCAVTTNEQVTSSSDQTLENCADKCAFNHSCTGFNHKDSVPLVCDIFTGLPGTFSSIDSACTYYEVFTLRRTRNFTANLLIYYRVRVDT